MIGRGVYTLAEASHYISVPSATLRSWFKWRSDGQGRGPLFKSDYAPVNGDYAISFLDLIDAYVAYFFRSNGVKTPSIRRAYEKLKDQLGEDHPFAREECKLSTDGNSVVYEILTRDGDAGDMDVIAEQMLFPAFKKRLEKISYDKNTKLADAWDIAKGVVINPGIGFGKPVIEHTGVSTLIVASQFVANDRDAALVARLFKTTEAGVMDAYRFECSHGRIAA
jgi:uncharacterized protein (DUF433 family)